jgi:F-type H+-transporting ATPase subunit gamma
MSEGSAALRARITSATDLQSMARTMKTMAAANIGQYDAAVRSLDLYHDVVQDSLAACLRRAASQAATQAGNQAPPARTRSRRPQAGAVVFGSDQGLVGAFNEAICAQVLAGSDTPAGYAPVWPVGERIAAALAERGVHDLRPLPLPASIDAIGALVARLLVEIEAATEREGLVRIDVFHHRQVPAGGYLPVCQRLLPLDLDWQRELATRPWPSRARAQVLPEGDATLRACISEYLFVSLYRACAESLASENAARLAAMQRAEKNIGDGLQLLTQTFHRERQGAIDEELFDLVAGFEAQQAGAPARKRGSTQNS